MKKHLFFLLILLSAGLGSCSQSTDDSSNPEQGLGPDHEAAPEGVGNAGEGLEDTESANQQNNQNMAADSLDTSGTNTIGGEE